jgi:hypothetical protein
VRRLLLQATDQVKNVSIQNDLRQRFSVWILNTGD